MPASRVQPFAVWGKTFQITAPTSGNTGNVKVTSTQSGISYRISAQTGAAFVTWGTTVPTPVEPTNSTAQTGVFVHSGETTVVTIPGLDASSGNVYFSAITTTTANVYITPGA